MSDDDEDSSPNASEEGDDDDVSVETDFEISLARLSKSKRSQYLIEALITALEKSNMSSTGTKPGLHVNFKNYEPTPYNNRRVVEPLCRYIANLRLQDEHHRLCELKLSEAWLNNSEVENVMQQFLVAAKQGGIIYMRLYGIAHFPVQFLVDFCRDNHNLKILRLLAVFFQSAAPVPGTKVTSLPKYENDNHCSLSLIIYGLWFQNATAASEFANFLPHLNVSALALMSTDTDVNFDAGADGDELALTQRIVSEFKMPSVQQLTVKKTCRLHHFQAALAAGTTTITHLNVDVSIDSNPTARLESLAGMIHRAVCLKSLELERESDGPPVHPPSSFFQAVEACATITKIHSQCSNTTPAQGRVLSHRDAQRLQRITARNQELALVMADPITYPTNQLPALMRQFQRCPTGRYLLARCLPEILAFEQIQSTTKRKSKRSPMPESTRQLRKKRNISYQV